MRTYVENITLTYVHYIPDYQKIRTIISWGVVVDQ